MSNDEFIKKVLEETRLILSDGSDLVKDKLLGDDRDKLRISDILVFSVQDFDEVSGKNGGQGPGDEGHTQYVAKHVANKYIANKDIDIEKEAFDCALCYVKSDDARRYKKVYQLLKHGDWYREDLRRTLMAEIAIKAVSKYVNTDKSNVKKKEYAKTDKSNVKEKGKDLLFGFVDFRCSYASAFAVAYHIMRKNPLNDFGTVLKIYPKANLRTIRNYYSNNLRNLIQSSSRRVEALEAWVVAYVLLTEYLDADSAQIEIFRKKFGEKLRPYNQEPWDEEKYNEFYEFQIDPKKNLNLFNRVTP